MESWPANPIDLPCLQALDTMHRRINRAGILQDAEADPEGLVGARSGVGSTRGRSLGKMNLSLEMGYLVIMSAYF